MSFSSHRRADSASSVNVSMSSSPHASSTALHAGTSPARSLRAPWKLRRPNLFTTFGDQSTLEAHEIPLPDSPSPPLLPNTPPLIGGASPYVDTPSRPSFTSSRTVSSTATTELLTPSSRAASRSAHTPSGSMWSLPVDASHMFDPPDSEVTIAKDPARKSLFSRPSTYTLRGIIPFAALPRKILVVSGIAPGEDYRLDALLVWCEGFGEVKEVSRAPNGDIHIDFKKTEVADTVCRLNAHVEIVGVGSVALNWKTMKKR